jgi:hypothetical protein
MPDSFNHHRTVFADCPVCHDLISVVEGRYLGWRRFVFVAQRQKDLDQLFADHNFWLSYPWEVADDVNDVDNAEK